MRAFAALAALALALPPPGTAQAPADEAPPLTAGPDVPAPKRTRFVAPAYPPEAQIQGLRGIVILELVINEQGKVGSASVVRSVPPFDEAALAAVRQWEYEVTKVDGRPVRVRLTVPITFALKLPEISRQEGIPELRQGAVPGFPPGAQGPARVVAEVQLQPDGSVAEASIKSGSSPWAEALLQALRTWRFAWEGEGAISFDVEANFGGGGGATPRVELKLSEMRRPADPAAAPADAPQSAEPAPEPALPASPEPPPPPGPGSPAPPAADTAPAPGPAPDAPPPSPVPEAAPEPRATPEPPPVEVISGGPVAPPATPPPPPQPGLSSVRDVSLAIGVPDLSKGRRPVVPPLARMAGAGGQVDVDFAVDAAGATSVQDLRGPDTLKEAARQTVASWAFRRTSAERLYLRAVFTYEGDQARAQVAIRGAE
jgi:TonB family protein